MYNGVLSTQNAYAYAKQMKSKRQTDEYYSLHSYIYSRQQHSKHHRVNANVYDSQRQTHTNTHTRAHVSFTQSCYFRSDWNDNAVDSILFNLTFSANIHLICSYLQHLAMVCCPFSWLFIRGFFFDIGIFAELFPNFFTFSQHFSNFSHLIEANIILRIYFDWR